MEPLLNPVTINSRLIQSDPWAEGHGVIAEKTFLGSSLLYYALAYMLPAKIAVVLGSGSGFVPRLIRQAQRDVHDFSFFKQSRCILIDADQDVKNFGKADYHDDPNHFFRSSFPDIEIWKMTSQEAIHIFQEQSLRIDYLHIDADHTYEQSLQDIENYLPCMAEDFLMTLHDTAIGHLELQHDGCIPRTIAYLRRHMEQGGKYDHLEMINFNNRFRQPTNYFQHQMTCRGIAILKPKNRSIWDTELAETLHGPTFVQSHLPSDT